MTFLTKTNGYQKMCDTNKNVTEMGVIIKGVYCIPFRVSLKKISTKNKHCALKSK